MNLGELGTTGLLVTPIGLGLAALGRPGYINLGHAEDLERNYSVDAMRAHSHQVLDEAWRGGVRYFDAARSYGKAEEFLGSWLASRQISPAEITVGSKWGYIYTAGWKVEAEKHEVKEHSLPVLERQWQDSQANLGPYLRLYQIHSATQESGVLEDRAVLDRLAQLKSEGIAIGLTLSGPKQAQTLRQAMDVYIDGRRLFDSVQATWNLLEQSAGAALAEARAAGIGTIIKETLANGLLTARNTDPAFAGKLSFLKSQAERLDTSIDALALAAVLAQPWADVALSGAATPEQVRSNLPAVKITWDEQAAGLLEALRETPDEYWSRRSELDWA